ncbi:uncharacterized protein L3040_009123 [Drepanopeziza brunnea f. sp. 'multigermtubi']|uniref:uncharacterized protein n=1 Tax=Drepanopeziza brunnea f. sp. 'multigermtubi' TaxID=698441 RepID=UPI0023876E91|nr:hypothetical protein L3040_009123 [Drepanopeziza brunnea f. sp. 'multigermtubi']
MDLPDAGLNVINSLGLSTPTFSRRSSVYIPRKNSWGTPIPPPSSRTATATNDSQEDLYDDVKLQSTDDDSSSSKKGNDEWNTLDNIAALGLSFHEDEAQVPEPVTLERFSLENLAIPANGDRPFNKWMKSLQRRATDRRKTVSCDVTGSALEHELFETPNSRRRTAHKKSSSGSSYGFVTAVKSASISLASFSVAPRSKMTAVSSRHQRTDRSSRASNVGRTSEDSSYLASGVAIDQAVTNRLLQRRRILEEIITTEESYLADVKFLMNVYVTLLASIPSLSLNLRSSINRNLNDIVGLHEDLLGELHKVVPNSEYTQASVHTRISPLRNMHQRWRSLDAVPEHTSGAAWLQKIPGMIAEPKIAAEVAKVFGKKMNRFFAYEEYGAKYEMMIRDIANTYRTIPQWETYQKGFEALASSLASINNQQHNTKKALTIGDLLVKPIQRVCRYPLLFSELLKVTPVCDCPDSHMEIENVLIRLREATTEINRATDDPRMKAIIEKSWLLQDRLIFPDTTFLQSKNYIRALGHIHLCGVLHVSWQTRTGIDGQYMICLLYRDFLLFASAPKNDQIYTVQACIGLSEMRIEEIDNGRGLQCHTAPCSWKLVFECDHQLFETTMSACSPKEELEWRSRLADRSGRDSFDAGEQALFTSLSLAIKPMGTVFGKPGTIARRISIHRATTVGPMTGLCQVIIKNTNAFKDTASCASIHRSQSLLMTNRIPVLAPSRADRIRLETLLADVWTREILPFPGMTSRARSEHLVRASASSMMRKLSVASIASNFTKRSGSMASLRMTFEDDESGEHDIMPGPPRSTPSRAEYHSDPIATLDPDDPDRTRARARARLSAIQDERDHGPRSESSLDHLRHGSPVNTLRRLATQKVKSWSHDGHRIITPPLRTSSANSVLVKGAPPTPRSAMAAGSMAASSVATSVISEKSEDKENMPQVGSGGGRQAKKEKEKEKRGLGIVKGRTGVAEGIRNFFR